MRLNIHLKNNNLKKSNFSIPKLLRFSSNLQNNISINFILIKMCVPFLAKISKVSTSFPMKMARDIQSDTISIN